MPTWRQRNLERAREIARNWYHKSKKNKRKSKATTLRCRKERLKKLSADELKLFYRRTNLSKFRVTPEWYERKLAEQGGGCGICGTDESHVKNREMPVDHSHSTGRVRGILCHRCNSALERIENEIDWAQKAHLYLTHYAEPV